MSFDIFQNIMTASDPAGGRAIKVTLQTGIDDAESYYTKSDSAGGRAIKVSLVGSGALILAGNVPLSTTPIAVADGAGSTSPLQLGTTRIVMNTGAAASRTTLNITSVPYTAGDAQTNHPVMVLGAVTGSIWSTAGTYLAVNAASGFTGNLLDFHVNSGASVFKVASSGVATYNATAGTTGIIFDVQIGGVSRLSVTGSNGIIGGATIGTTNSTITNFKDPEFNVNWAVITPTTGKVTYSTLWRHTALPTTRPSTVGDIYVDTAANILANGDRILAIRV